MTQICRELSRSQAALRTILDLEPAYGNKLPDKVYGRISEVQCSKCFHFHRNKQKPSVYFSTHTQAVDIVKTISAHTASNYLILRP